MGVNTALLALYNPSMTVGALQGKVGQLAAGGATTTASTAVVLSATVPTWVVSGMPVYNLGPGHVGNVGAVTGTPSGTSVTLAANAATAISTGDTLLFGLPPADTTQAQTAPYADDVNANIWAAALRCQEAAQLLTRAKAILTAASDATNAATLTTQITNLS